MSMNTCKHCGCGDIEFDQARGDSVCTGCGSVLEDNLIVSEVQFEETGHGGGSAVGQFVSSDGNFTRHFGEGFHSGLGKESRAITLENGRRKIAHVAQQLRLNQHCVDTAVNFFKMAVGRRLTRGRKSSHVIAACLYMVCRLEATPHMLLDFSDVLQVNVYDLGKAFLRLSCALCINVPSIDPCMYIARFANRLQFEDKTHEVSMTAMRLVQRMKRDWMHMGRRPSGLCGAALLVAARIHNFNRTTRDIIKVVKVCEATLRKRLTEFGDTPTSKLTLEEFMTIDLEEEQDPPSFKAARKKARLEQQQLDDDKAEEATLEISCLSKEIERVLEKRRKKLRGPLAKLSQETPEQTVVPVLVPELAAVVTDETVTEETVTEEAATAEFLEEETMSSIVNFLSSGVVDISEKPIEVEISGSTVTAAASWVSAPLRGLGNTAASLGLTQTIEECMAVTDKQSEVSEDGELDLTGIDDAELDSYIMSESEVQRKTILWHRINAEYLKEMKEKEEKAEKEKEENAGKEKKRKRVPKKKQVGQASTAGEAIERMLLEKKISNKINYEVLRHLSFGDGLSQKEKTEDPSQTKELEDPKQEELSQQSRCSSDNVEKTLFESQNEKPNIEENVEKDKSVETECLTIEAVEDVEEEEEEEEEEEVEDESNFSVMQLLRRHAGEADDDQVMEYEQEEEYM